MVPLKPGKLNRRITVQSFLESKDAEGIVTKGWVDYASLWANREPLRGREYFQASSVQAENTVRFKIRYRCDITSSMRVLCEGRMYEINSVLDDVYGDRTETHLMCTEVSTYG